MSAPTSHPPTSVGPAKAGRLFFAAAFVGTGFQHLIARDFVTRMVPGVPAWLPARPVLACVLGTLLIVLGLALASGKKVRAAAAPHEPMEWAGVCESLAMSGVALLLAGTDARGRRRLA